MYIYKLFVVSMIGPLESDTLTEVARISPIDVEVKQCYPGILLFAFSHPNDLDLYKDKTVYCSVAE